MNSHHRIALEYHCRFGFETIHWRFYFTDPEGKASIGITVNSGYE